MNIPNKYTNFRAELFKSAIIIELKERVIEHRVLTVTETLEESQLLAKQIAELHDVILISEQREPVRPVGMCYYPMKIVMN